MKEPPCFRMEVGIRVVRGPDWKWKDQDSGEGNLGTVVEIGKPGNANTPDKTAVIHWDNGFRTNYRIGYQSAYDLRVYDIAPTGTKHPNIVCDECKRTPCKTQGIMGIRWKCSRCPDYDLCHVCYMQDKHDVTHPFIRFITPGSQGTKVDPRANAVKVRAQGIFKGAQVVRGPDWDWGNQDGGEGQVGTVLDLRGWDSESSRSVANIAWSTGVTNVYRLGHKGKVDLKCIASAPGGTYYREHLPVLGQDMEARQAPNIHNDFKVGDRVRVDLEVDLLKTMQEGHGGWNPRMADYIGKVGYVHRITDKGDVRVKFENCTNRWTFYTGALTKVQLISVGDYVKVSDDMAKVQSLQKGHGEWTDSMRTILGKTGRVQRVYQDGDLRITVGKNVWTINPVSCTLLPHAPAQQENSNTSEADKQPKRKSDPTESLAEYMGALSHEPSTSANSQRQRLVKAAAQGKLDTVKELLAANPEMVDEKSLGKTALQVASHQGHRDIVALLLEQRASLHLQDDDGDTALHYSAFGNQPEIMELIIERGATLDARNSTGCTALHVAVNKIHIKCVETLLAFKCNVNIQDSVGDTALHDAISKDKRAHEIVSMLLAYPSTELKPRNKRDFNVLHQAALKGNNHAVGKILHVSRDLVDVRKEDGYSALHLAALNGHFDVISTLLSAGRAEVDIKNNRHQTPLYLAVSHAHAHIVELLIKAGASLSGGDEEGETVLHQALCETVLRKKIDKQVLQHAPTIAQISSQLASAGLVEFPSLPIACFLLQRGADPSTKNTQGRTPLDVLSMPQMSHILKRYIKYKQESAPNTSRGSSKNGGKSKDGESTKRDRVVISKLCAAKAVDCIVCEEMYACVTFQPCGHMVTCTDCCARMKKCIHCKVEIEQKYGPDKKPVSPFHRAETSEKRVQELENRLQNMEDVINCSICMERRRTVAFMCGHSTCTQCANALDNCHICRKPINKKIPLYES